MDFSVLMQLNETYRYGVYGQVDEDVLTEEELLDIQEWVEDLIASGVNINDYTDDELYEAYLMEAPFDIYRGSTEHGGVRVGPNEPIKVNKKPYKTKKGARRAVDRLDQDYGSYAHYVVRTPENLPEEFDLYDVISDFLVTEGYCNSYDDAYVIMANMSEEWRDSILDEVRGFGGFIPKGGTDYAPARKEPGSHERNVSPAFERGAKARGDFRLGPEFGGDINKAYEKHGVRSRYARNFDQQQLPYQTQTRDFHGPRDAGQSSGLSMSPSQRAELAAKRAERQGQGKRANKIRSRMGF